MNGRKLRQLEAASSRTRKVDTSRWSADAGATGASNEEKGAAGALQVRSAAAGEKTREELAESCLDQACASWLYRGGEASLL